MNESESTDEVTKSLKLPGKSTLCKGSVKQRSRHLIYWLRADRYSGDMTLKQALKENLGDPAGET